MKTLHMPSSLRTLSALALTALFAGLLPGTAQAASPPTPGKVFKDCKDLSLIHISEPTRPY